MIFTFYSSHGKDIALEDITFGCSTDSRNIKYALLPDKNPVSGVLGMGWGFRSFVAQLGSISDGKPSSAYYVNLLGISVDGVKLNISKTDLAIEKDDGGGCVIDSSTLATLLVKPSFDTVHTALADHLSSNQKLKRPVFHKLHQDLCYEELSDNSRKNLPVVIFHFEKADLDV
ncbi:hypothetical protein SADUNF_Sadunf03G0157000 [Salix dunnii]|uniref:Xylanase inhibitor C-terminal domain-containing protein n=1 Tax=Salix dunnii TaxID=1413687 RepID=A0A835N528_9ROSI|nr:hypothetical protein SADUNF_Sadunf03G0157000 [Salix dunnii]